MAARNEIELASRPSRKLVNATLNERRRRPGRQERGADREAASRRDRARTDRLLARGAVVRLSICDACRSRVHPSARAQALFAGLIGIIDDPADWRIERGTDVLILGGTVVGAAVGFLWPVIVLLTLAGIVASVRRRRCVIAPERITPDPSRISPRNGFKRLFGIRGAVEYLKSLIKLKSAVGLVAGMMLFVERAVLLDGYGGRSRRLSGGDSAISPSKRWPL